MKARAIEGSGGLFKLKKPDFSNPQTRRVSIVLAVAAVAILTTVTASALTLTSQNFFCGSACHFVMKYDVEAFEKSSHANVQCISCHIPPDILVFAEHKMNGLKELYMAVTNTYEWPINPKAHLSEEIPNENCNLCHSVENRKVTTSEGVIIDHKKHIEKGVKCSYCHNRVGHPELSVDVSEEQLAKLKEHEASAEKAEVPEADKPEEEGVGKPVDEVKIVKGKFTYINMISMEGCTRCHGLEKTAKASGKCELCHTKGFELKPENHRQVTWMKFDLTHRADHGQKAKEDSKYCSQCHAKTFCSNCHGVDTMPHPESFKVAKAGRAQHAEIGQANPETCRKCHTQADFCTACHHKKDGYQTGSPWVQAKGIPMTHPTAVKDKGASNCFTCHDERYCSSCHIRGVADNAFLSKKR
ncbi:MAG: cytochrome c3 family protein [Candidatus Aquicultorales bacterium]